MLTELERNQANIEQPLPHSHSLEQLDQLFTLLDKHLHEHKKVSAYARIMNLSAFQLNKITKSIFGKTCSEVIIEQVILEAKRNLLATTNQIKEIAFELGFEDVSYFIRYFKKYEGITPMEFRKKFK